MADVTSQGVLSAVARQSVAAGGYAAAVNADSPIAYYRLGEASGTTATDETGSYDMTYANTPTLGVTGALTGDADTAVTFTAASSEYANITGSPPLGISGYPITVEAWVKTTTTSSDLVWSMADNTVENKYFILYVQSTGKAVIGGSNTTSKTAASTTLVNDGNWHQIVAKWISATNWEIWVDGSYENNLIDNVTWASVLDCSIGRQSDSSPSNYFDGTIDEVSVYASDLSSARISAHYTAATGFVTQDFTTYTEVDVGADITVTASTVSWNDLDRDVNSYVYKDFGVDNFNGDFTHRFEMVASDVQGGTLAGANHWLVANSLGSTATLDTANASYTSLLFYANSNTLYLRSHEGGVGNTDDTAVSLVLGTRYYITITRDHDGGANSTGQYVATIRTGSHTGTVFDTLTVDVAAGDQNSWRYLYGMASFDGGSNAYSLDGETTTLEIKDGL